MSDLLNEQLSALMDGELPPEETALLLRRLEREPELAARLARYSAIGDALLLVDEIFAIGRLPLGALLLVGSAIFWAIGTVLISRYPVGLPLTAFAAWQTLLSWGLITVLSLIFEQGPFHPFHLSPWAQFGAWYNGLVSFIFCFWAWTKISSQAPPTVSSMVL